MITLYDMGPSTLPKHLGCSPHVRKIIFALNYKKIPFTLVNLSLDSIQPTAKSVDAPPTTTSADGAPKYTVPFIYDHDNKKAVSDSLDIAKYLDKAYPDAPRLFAEGSEKAQEDLINAWMQAIGPVFPLLMVRIWDLFSEEMKQDRIRRGEEAMYTSIRFTKEQEKEAWEKSKKAFNEVKRVDVEDNEFVFANMVLGVIAGIVKIAFGEESDEWKDMSSWADGNVGRAVDTAAKHESQMVSE
ncbi:hypothetical protein AAF712_016143 [Marasmius tenuissimus]|uniref:GST N-terminal domain-containing protein n=1 Tax=Marasmius tenuissimus TaxID=585030 RepID=A0ABR2Z8Q0_9AGAR